MLAAQRLICSLWSFYDDSDRGILKALSIASSKQRP
jgi:hypothetical protein